MSGLGLTFLRRGGQAHPTAGSDISIDSYIKDDALVIFDGIEKGSIEGQWTSLIDSNHTFVNYGAIEEEDGWRFDGASSYLWSTTLPAYSWHSGGDRTMEIVAEFERSGMTEIVMMGKAKGMSFGKYVNNSCLILTESGVSANTIADDMTAGLMALGVAIDGASAATTFLNGIKNGIPISASEVLQNNGFGGSTGAVILGKRISGNHFKGKIYAIRIHNRALTNDELLYNYEIDKKRFKL